MAALTTGPRRVIVLVSLAQRGGSIDVLRGDLVSQRREKPRARSQASFDRNEGEDARWFDKSGPTGTGKEPQGARLRPSKEAERSAGAADGDLRGARCYQPLVGRSRSRFRHH